MAFTEFCCRSGGSNLNAGTRTGDSTVPGTTADLTYASGTWVSATGVFTVAAGDPVADGVAVGDFASVYADGASETTLVGRVTARTTTTITVSTSVKSGTTTDGTSNRTLKIGGAWQGPNGAVKFPFAFVTNALTNSSANKPRVNFKNDATYSISAAITHSNTQTYFEGFSTSYGDGGRFTVDGSTNAIVLLTISGVSCGIGSVVVSNNGASGTNAGLVVSSNNGYIRNAVANNIRGYGISTSGASSLFLEECEVYSCNTAGTANQGGFQLAHTGSASRCISHHNSGTNNHGFVVTGLCVLDHCISDSNGGKGFYLGLSGGSFCHSCDAYNNGGDGFQQALAGAAFMTRFESCNAVKNGGYGINIGFAFGVIRNSGFGAGTQANTSGETGIPATSPIEVLGSVTYGADVTPWVDPANGDFRINLAAAKGAGRGTFTQTASSYAGTIGYPDIGAAQSTGSGGTTLIVIED